jgi:hypothetical protein
MLPSIAGTGTLSCTSEKVSFVGQDTAVVRVDAMWSFRHP